MKNWTQVSNGGRGKQTLSHVLYQHAVLRVGDPAALEVLSSGAFILGKDGIEFGDDAASCQGDEGLLDELLLREQRRHGVEPVVLQVFVGECAGSGLGNAQESA